MPIIQWAGVVFGIHTEEVASSLALGGTVSLFDSLGVVHRHAVLGMWKSNWLSVNRYN